MSDDQQNLILAPLREIRGELASLRSLRDDVNVLTAIIQRLDKSHTRLLAEIRATRSQV